MRAFCYMKPGLEYKELPDPQVTGPTDVKIKMSYASICGSDAHILQGAFDDVFDSFGTPPPFLFGHEASGVITEMGDGCNTKGLKVGDHVIFYFLKYCGKCHYCRTGNEAHCTGVRTDIGVYNEYMVVDEQQVYKLPEGMDMRLACLAEPTSVALHGIDRAQVKPGMSMAIFGGSAIGLLTLEVARLSGAVPIVCIEPVESKRQLALKLGADYVLDPAQEDFMEQVMKITKGRGFDRVMECAGHPSCPEPAFEILAKGGTLTITATHGPDYRMPLNCYEGYNKEATIKFVLQSEYALPRTVELLPRLELEGIITAEFPFEQTIEAFKEQATGKHPKVIIRF